MMGFAAPAFAMPQDAIDDTRIGYVRGDPVNSFQRVQDNKIGAGLRVGSCLHGKGTR
jgi:hypothetical protein